ncbi:hypothetical protein CBL_09402 [Carabus blaptoides fortunei]
MKILTSAITEFFLFWFLGTEMKKGLGRIKENMATTRHEEAPAASQVSMETVVYDQRTSRCQSTVARRSNRLFPERDAVTVEYLRYARPYNGATLLPEPDLYKILGYSKRYRDIDSIPTYVERQFDLIQAVNPFQHRSLEVHFYISWDWDGYAK